VALFKNCPEDVVAYKMIELGRGISTEIRHIIKDVRTKMEKGPACLKVLLSL
jgi:hypothetical protein